MTKRCKRILKGGDAWKDAATGIMKGAEYASYVAPLGIGLPIAVLGMLWEKDQARREAALEATRPQVATAEDKAIAEQNRLAREDAKAARLEAANASYRRPRSVGVLSEADKATATAAAAKFAAASAAAISVAQQTAKQHRDQQAAQRSANEEAIAAANRADSSAATQQRIASMIAQGAARQQNTQQTIQTIQNQMAARMSSAATASQVQAQELQSRKNAQEAQLRALVQSTLNMRQVQSVIDQHQAERQKALQQKIQAAKAKRIIQSVGITGRF